MTADGRVVSTNDAKVQDWRDIVAVSAESDFILGLTSAGRVLSTGDVDVSGWRLFRNLDTIEQERWQAASRCQHCGGEFKGLFKKTCTVCGNPKDY